MNYNTIPDRLLLAGQIYQDNGREFSVLVEEGGGEFSHLLR